MCDGLLCHYENYHTFTQLETVGVVGLIIPRNGPFFLAMLKVAPALAAGCSATENLSRAHRIANVIRGG